jgi:molecular chaperone DnaK (HSP70)
MTTQALVAGIDLGTTNSEIAAFLDDKVQIIGLENTNMLPSCVGLSPAGDLLVGTPARNQQLLYPELTVRSIKRKMGNDEKVSIGDKSFTPQEISSLILKELARWAELRIGAPLQKAIISVPAYFSDAQRNATREAGALAGLEVVRILNEPTAASLAYGYGSDHRRTVMIYDLGGGTFDVSIVTMEKDVTEVLASHGNNRLGGDDFDQLLVDRLLKEFREQHGIDLSAGHRQALARLWWSAEEAKRGLSSEPFVRIREEALVKKDGESLHFETEISREEFEKMIAPLMESTLDCVTRALEDAGKRPGDLDAILLVGGSTRMPMVSRLLEERTGIVPRNDIHPDLCVALGAGVLGARLHGKEVNKILVDVTPYSFGPSYLGELNGMIYPHCYRPIIRANTALPVTRTERYFTCQPYQTRVDIDIYQGEDRDALKNIPVGHFGVEGLRAVPEHNVVLCKMSLDIDGILKVTAIEKDTGKSKQITIDGALKKKSEQEIERARKRMQELFDSRSPHLEDEDGEGDEGNLDQEEEWEEDAAPDDLGSSDQGTAHEGVGGDALAVSERDPQWEKASEDAARLLERSRGLLDTMHDEDKEEAIDLHEEIEMALAAEDRKALGKACRKLNELLFFVEGR